MKRWLIIPMANISSIPGEWHSVHLADDLAFIGAADLQPHDITALQAIPNVIILPAINSRTVVGTQVASILTDCGVLDTDTTYDILEKVIATTGLHQVGLRET